MKREDVYDRVTNIGVQLGRKDADLSNSQVLQTSLTKSRPKVKEIVDSKFNNVYKSGSSIVKKLPFYAVAFIISLAVPTDFKFKILVGIVGCVVIEFIDTKGHRFLIKDIKSKMIYKDDFNIMYKPKLGKYENIVIGRNEDGLIEVHKVEGLKASLIKPKYYYADKEILSEMICRYVEGNSEDIIDAGIEAKDEIINDYYYVNGLRVRTGGMSMSNSFSSKE